MHRRAGSDAVGLPQDMRRVVQFRLEAGLRVGFSAHLAAIPGCQQWEFGDEDFVTMLHSSDCNSIACCPRLA